MSAAEGRRPRRPFLAPEVIQTSAMDCGPAALKSLCEGFAIPVSYGRLREACQTDIDGTSIDVIEEVACRLGLDAQQSMVPFDHLLLPEARLLPALVVVTNARVAHFVVVWRRVGGWVQVMDPGDGRRWVSERALLRELYSHEMCVPADALRQWLGSEEFLAPLRRRIVDLGIPRSRAAALVLRAVADPSYRSLAALDASTRMLASLTRSRALPRGSGLEPLLVRLATSDEREGLVPESYWSCWPAPDDDNGEPQASLRGAVLMQVRGRGPTTRAPEADDPDAEGLSPAAIAGLTPHEPSPWSTLVRLVAQGGEGTLVAVVFALLVSAAAVSAQALVLRGLLDMGRWLGLGGERLAAVGTAVLLLLGLLLVTTAASSGMLRVGRRLELRLRMAFLRKIPRIHDQYFASRSVSDMAERAHSIASIRSLPGLLFRMFGAVFLAGFTLAGILWLAPWSATVVVVTVALATMFGWLVHPWLLEHDRRVRTHVGALARYYLDAFMGATCLSAHGAHDRLMQGHEAVVVRWAEAQHRSHRLGVLVDAVQTVTGFALAWWLVLRLGAEARDAANALLLAYWALRLPAIGQGLASMARALPGMLVATERVLEPLGSPEVRTPSQPSSDHADVVARLPPTISIRQVTVRKGGHAVLADVSLEIAAGSHVAVVGSSGSGKSTLLGLLLGWNRPARGELLVDGIALDDDQLARLRPHTAWVDPSVQLWNQSLLANLTYRADPSTQTAQEVGLAMEAAELQQVLERLPQGLQTPLGDNGGLVSGGEGQRARFARALMGRPCRLALLDEPFRGLDKDQRHRLLARARRQWSGATMLCATHDVQETLDFDRVLVVEGGRIVEDGDPRRLASDPGSRYARLLAAERAIAERIWGSPVWRRVRVEGGRVHAAASSAASSVPSRPRRGRTMRLTAAPRAAGGLDGAG